MSHFEPDSIAKALSELADEARSEDGDIDFETLVAFREGRLDGPAAERARRALVAEPGLAEALLDFDRLDELEAFAQVDRRSREASWSRFEAAAAISSPTPMSAAERSEPGEALRSASTDPSGARRIVTQYPLLSLAATCLLSVALTWLLLRPGDMGSRENLLYEQLEMSREEGPKRGAVAELPRLTVPSGTDEVILSLIPPGRLSLDADLPARARFVFWRGERLQAMGTTLLQDEGLYVLSLPAEWMVDGLVGRVELADPSRNTDLAVYHFLISRSE